MQKYKITITRTYCVDLLIKDEVTEKNMIEKAKQHLDEAMQNGVEHYLQIEDAEIEVYDVTNTEDPFNPINNPLL